MRSWLSAFARLLGQAIAAIGVDVLVLILGLVMVTVGLWPWIGRGALLVPGVVLTWLSLPSRLPFVLRPDASRRKS